MATNETGNRPFRHDGKPGAALVLGLGNLVLDILTLFLWRFWAKTRLRRFVWSATTAWGDPLEYTGRGQELFVGFLVVLVVVFLPFAGLFALATALTEAHNPRGPALASALQLLGLTLAGAGLYRARRYQLTRTVWRGIRGGLTGAAWQYGLLWLGMLMLAGATLGWSLPWGDMLLARTRMGNTCFGDRNFTCTAKAEGLYRYYAGIWLGAVAFLGLAGVSAALLYRDQHNSPHAAAIFVAAALGLLPLALVMIGLPSAAYRAAFYRHLAAGTTFGAVSFALDLRILPLLWLSLGNWALMIVSLGIAKPWVASRTVRFACDALEVIGEPDFASIHQNQDAPPKLGEGLASVFDGAGDF